MFDSVRALICWWSICAAAFLGYGLSTFDDHVRPDLPSVLAGTKKTFTLTALRKWVVDHTVEARCRESRSRGVYTNAPIPATGGSHGVAAVRAAKPSTYQPSPLVQKLREKLRAAG